MSQEAGQKASPSGAAESYPNSAEDLKLALAGLLTTAKSDEPIKLRSMIAAMEIPNYDNWFTRTYGEEKGQPLASAYGKSLAQREQEFELLWMELAKQEGEISISKVDATSRGFVPAKGDDALANPADDFTAHWKKTDSSTGPASQSIGFFCHVDGKFRLKSFPHEVQILSSGKARSVSSARPVNVVPARLINKVPPVYPALARQLKIQGLVSLNVLIGKDGTLTVQNVGAAAHQLLVPAAVAAVEQWKYEPTRIDGEPFDAQTKVYVTFTLTN